MMGQLLLGRVIYTLPIGLGQFGLTPESYIFRGQREGVKLQKKMGNHKTKYSQIIPPDIAW